MEKQQQKQQKRIMPESKNDTDNLQNCTALNKKGRNLSPDHNQNTTHWKIHFEAAASVQWSSVQSESQNQHSETIISRILSKSQTSKLIETAIKQ